MSLYEIAQICKGRVVGDDLNVRKFITDSRTLFDREDVIFCAIKGDTFNGHNYVNDVIDMGVKAFIIDDESLKMKAEVSYIVVDDTLKAIQLIAGYYRSKFNGIIAVIIGSNGKSVVKEWVSQITAIEKNPKSYNSQLGVALSILEVPKSEEFYFFEAGISKCNEMQILESILKPDVVLLTTLSSAHSGNFDSKQVKIAEKLIMAKRAKVLIYCKDNIFSCEYIEHHFSEKRLFSWGEKSGATLHIVDRNNSKQGQSIRFIFESDSYIVSIPFNDKISYENVMSAISYIAATHKKEELIASIKRCKELESVEMRLEIKQGKNNSIIVNDCYNSDLTSLSIALDTLNVNGEMQDKVVILSDIRQSHFETTELYEKVYNLLKVKGIDYFYGVGEDISSVKNIFSDIDSKFFLTTNELVDNLSDNEFKDKIVLLKGSRLFKFEQISSVIEEQVHTTILEVNLSTILSNYLYLKSLIHPKTKCMAMVKADAYGCGAVEVAKLLEKQDVNYFAVAYADEGVKLREAGIKIPIVILNSEPHAYKTMINFGLEPEIYSFKSLKEFTAEVKHSLDINYPIHIKLDTGMHRLGFSETEVDLLIGELKDNKWVKVASIFSHLSSSDNTNHDIYTNRQIELYDKLSLRMKIELNLLNSIRHISNSAAIERFKNAEFDMVRLGISLYCPNDDRQMKSVLSLKSTIAQIHTINSGETIGYNKNQILTRNSQIAVIPIGYADGLRRALSCGVWSFEVNGKLAPIVGNICMDSCMIDVTNIDCNEGDKVVIFGHKNTINLMSEKLNTITYEIITLISSRVKRVYIKD